MAWSLIVPLSPPLPPTAPRSPVQKMFARGLDIAILLSNLYLLIAWLFGIDRDYQLLALWLWLSPWYLLQRGYWYYAHPRETAAAYNPVTPLDVTDPIELLRALSPNRHPMSWLTPEAVKKLAIGLMAFAALVFLVQGNLYMLFDYTYTGHGDYKRYENCNYYNLLRPKKTNIGRDKDGYCDIFVLYRGQAERKPAPDPASLYVPPLRAPRRPPQTYTPPPNSSFLNFKSNPGPPRLPDTKKKEIAKVKPQPKPKPKKPAFKEAYIWKKSVKLANPYQEENK